MNGDAAVLPAHHGDERTAAGIVAAAVSPARLRDRVGKKKDQGVLTDQSVRRIAVPHGGGIPAQA